MHRRRIELVLDAPEMIEPLDRAIEFGAVFLGELFFHAGNGVGELGPIQILHRGGDVSQHGETLIGHFGETTVRIPGRIVATTGACPASTPKSPSTPGTSTWSTSPEKASFSGETRSKWKVAMVFPFFPLSPAGLTRGSISKN